MSRLITTTVKEPPADAELVSHQLLVRAGYIKQHSSGVFSILPLGLRSMARIETIIREEMDAIGGQELLMPVVITADLWRESGRWQDVGAELLRFRDRNDKDMVLGMTHEEPVTDIARRYLNSYRQLPAMVYQIQTKYRDEARPRGGLIRLREFIMKDAYSFHATSEDLDRYYEHVYRAYGNVFRRAGLDVVVVQSDPGMMGGKIAHEFMAVTPGGEDTLVLCRDCDYAANREIARSARSPEDGPELRLELVHTPGCKTIADLASYLGIPPSRLAKTLAYIDGDDRLILVLVRGDLDVNSIKLQNHLHREVAPAAAETIRNRGMVPGYMSPVGIDRPDVVTLVDPSVALAKNLACGGNRDDYHYINSCCSRDYDGQIADVANVIEGDTCIQCGGKLETVRAIEAGNIFKLGTKYSDAMGARFVGDDGASRPLIMGCYGIGVARILAAAVETNHDQDGMRLPITIAPADIYLVSLDAHKDEAVLAAAEGLYRDLVEAGVQVLYDDRRESPGIKFKDADLLGLPIRATVSPRTQKRGAVEIRVRDGGETYDLPVDEASGGLQDLCEKMRGELHARREGFSGDPLVD